MSISRFQSGIRLIAIPTGDLAFAKVAERAMRSSAASSPAALEERLRRLFPRVVVRAREISGEDAWYVYRDGAWSAPLAGPWWVGPALPRLAVTREGWIAEANPTALGLLEIEADDVGSRHFTDFVAPGSLEDLMAAFEIVMEGRELTATVLIRPSSGHILAVDLHARPEGSLLTAVLRLTDGHEPVAAPINRGVRPTVDCLPAIDAAFRGYVELALSRMPEPTPDGLALRIRRLYPHAEVVASGARWTVWREPGSSGSAAAAWWTDHQLPSVRYDAEGLIVAANGAAEALFGRSLVGHHWQEFVTPGSGDDVTAMLAILTELGRAESRFRMPRADGYLVEFDSYTEVNGETFTTIVRSRE